MSETTHSGLKEAITMEYRAYGKTGQKVSLLGFGAMRFPTENDKIEPVQSQKMIDLAYENGVNYFDTAYRYHNGESQSFLGQALKKYDRSTYFLTNKLPIWMCETPEDMERIFNDQLEKCQVDYFDFYLIHALNGERFELCKKLGTYDFLKQKQAEGKIRNIGFSFHDTPEVLEKICSTYQWDFAHIQLNYLDWEIQRAKEQYEVLCRHNIPCVVMEPVRGGALASLAEDANKVLKDCHPEKSIASWAIKFAASLPNVLTVLSGMTLEEQVKDNLSTMKDFAPLTEEEQDVLQKALQIHKQVNTLPCTGCRYCIDCPASVNIPEIFRVYNHYKLNNGKEVFLEDMEKIGDRGPENCIECGSCMEQCPQKIQIPEELKKIRALVEELKNA